MNIIIHPDEIFLKGNNQPFFYNKLKLNLEDLFPGSKVKRIEFGLWLENFEEKNLARLALAPGIANFAPAIKCGNELGSMQKLMEKFAIELLAKEGLGKVVSFRISAERSYKKYPLSSFELEKELGDQVRKKTGWKVNLNSPDITMHIAVTKDETFIFGNLIEGAGGLPTGSSGKVMCLLSGGIDSPAAAYQMMRRGAEVALMHFQNQTRVTEEVSQKIIDLANILSNYQPRVKLVIYPFAAIQRQIIMKIPAEQRMLITRRLMLRLAEEQANTEKYLALVTGDSLGQVASQTLENLNAVYKGAKILKLAPLIGTNKREIMALARKIGTLDISNRPYEDCCSLFVARHPKTKARAEALDELEKKIDLSALDKKEIKSYYIGNN